MMKYLTYTNRIIIFLLISAFSASAQVNEFEPLSDTEKQLARYINQRFTEHGYNSKPISKSLTATARWNIWDLDVNKPTFGGCSINSWSNAMPYKWTAYCDREDADTTPLFAKPYEIANYEGANYISLRQLSSVYPSLSSLKRKIESIAPWERGEAISAMTFGVAARKDFIALWFGDLPDSNGYHSTKTSLSNVSGLWYDKSLNGSGFNFLTLPNGQTSIIFYGNTQTRGERLWLMTDPIMLIPNQTVITQLYEYTGATFTTPITRNRAQWGTLSIKLDSCTNGQARIQGKDGTLNFDNLVLLVAPDGSNCI